jgi:hypothetical protein
LDFKKYGHHGPPKVAGTKAIADIASQIGAKLDAANAQLSLNPSSSAFAAAIARIRPQFVQSPRASRARSGTRYPTAFSATSKTSPAPVAAPSGVPTSPSTSPASTALHARLPKVPRRGANARATCACCVNDRLKLRENQRFEIAMTV